MVCTIAIKTVESREDRTRVEYRRVGRWTWNAKKGGARRGAGSEESKIRRGNARPGKCKGNSKGKARDIPHGTAPPCLALCPPGNHKKKERKRKRKREKERRYTNRLTQRDFESICKARRPPLTNRQIFSFLPLLYHHPYHYPS